MKLEQFLKQGIEEFNKGPRKRDWNIWFKMVFVESPLMFIGLTPKKYKSKKKSTGSIFGRIIITLISLAIYFRMVDWSESIFDVPDFAHYIVAAGFLYLAMAGFWILISGMLFADPESIKAKQFEKKYREEYPDGLEYSDSEYKQAAELLRKLKPIEYLQAIDKYDQKLVDLLILSGAAMIMNGKLRRLMSIKSIEEDREAGPDDE